MTDEEIRKIAREFGVLLAKDIPLSNCLKNEVINSTEDYIVEFLQWLSERYCVVEKSKIEEWSDRAEFTAFDAIDLIEIFDDIFGKDIFNEKKK